VKSSPAAHGVDVEEDFDVDLDTFDVFLPSPSTSSLVSSFEHTHTRTTVSQQCTHSAIAPSRRVRTFCDVLVLSSPYTLSRPWARDQ
jgi:hypothetical protein